MKEKYLQTGEIVSTQGLHGEIKIMPWADRPEFLTEFDTVYLNGVPCRVESSRVQKTCVVMKLAGIDTVEQAAALRGKKICIDRDDAHLAPGTVFIADLIGLPVFCGERELGRLAEVMTMPANDVYVVRGEQEYLIPAVPEFLEEVNADGGYIRVRLLEGMRSDEV